MSFRKSFLCCAIGLALSSQVQASDEFVVEDIRVNGLQRVALGATLTYIPFQIGDQASPFRISQSIKTLYQSGHFQSIDVYKEGSTLIYKVKERPTISAIELDGNDDIKEEQLTENLDSQNIKVGEPLDKTVLSRIEKGLEDFYQSIGKYNAKVEAVVSYLPRNRVKLTFKFNEGDGAKVKQLNIIGNTAYDDELLLADFESKQDLAWWQFLSKDRYQKQTLQGDMETLESKYKDNGYIRFDIDSTQVSLTPDKEQVYVALNLKEGEQYYVSGVEFIGDLIKQDASIERLMSLKNGDLYSAGAVTAAEENISKFLGNFGYAFPEVKTATEIDDETNQVKLVVNVIPGKRVNVRRILFIGNEVTADEVLRRELRQMEASWLSSYTLEISKARIARLAYVEKVEYETVRIPGENDLVDIIFTIKEQPSGSFNAGIGYGDLTGLSLQAGIEQTNFLGTGNSVAASVNTISYAKTVSLSYTDPYFTIDGVSLGGNLAYSEYNYGSASSNTEDYDLTRFSTGLNLGYPIDEINRINFGVGFLHYELSNSSTVSEQRKPFYLVYANEENPDDKLVFDNFEGNVGWIRSTLNRGLFPTAGSQQRANFKATLPNSDSSYFKLTIEDKHYFPLDSNHEWVFTTRFRAGYANSYGEYNGNDHVMPFWEYFSAGGSSTMRGFENNTVGPKIFYRQANSIPGIPDENGLQTPVVLEPEFDSITKLTGGRSNGGNAMALGTLELIFPLPFGEEGPSSSVRSSLFVDAGNVWDTEFNIDNYRDLPDEQFSQIDDYADPGRYRASGGLSIQWISPMGPIVFSFSKPLKKYIDDDTKFFSFNVGRTF